MTIEMLRQRVFDLVRSGDTGGAIDACNIALADPCWPDAHRALALRAFAEEAGGDCDASIKSLEDAIALNSHWVGHPFQLALLHFARNRFDATLKFAAKVIDLESERSGEAFREASLLLMAASHVELRNFAAAREILTAVPAESEFRAHYLIRAKDLVRAVNSPESHE